GGERCQGDGGCGSSFQLPILCGWPLCWPATLMLLAAASLLGDGAVTSAGNCCRDGSTIWAEIIGHLHSSMDVDVAAEELENWIFQFW
ncbi:hypothetical protein Dimus_016440, partial [Dionaea muscipula]